ncbi:MAG: hypothetical protein EBZ85_05505, partial [Actinobacteria bacterium]|nr:hypothetical protein [Actinomycetota bacterium]
VWPVPLHDAHFLGVVNDSVIDLIIIFYFTKPLVSLLAKVKFFQSGSKFSGLSPKSIGMQNAVTAGEA